MRTWMGLALAALLLVAGVVLQLRGSSGPPLPAAQSLAQPPDRIVLILIDTLRRDHVSAYWSPELAASRVPLTPNIDALAGAGQVFGNAYSSFHQTTMSMASLFTGRTPSLESEKGAALEWNGRNWCGMRRFATVENAERCVPDELPTLAEALRAEGYWTLGVVTNALLFSPLGYERGFDTWLEVGGQAKGDRDTFGEWSYTERGASAANQALRVALAERPSDRFFLYLHFMDVHDYVYDVDVTYREGVQTADRGVGEVLDFLDAEGLLDGTVIVVASDHGERLGEEHLLPGMPTHFGSPSFEEHLRVPLVAAPAVFQDTRAPIRGDDLHRMLAALGGVAHPQAGDLEGTEMFVSEQGFQVYRRGRWKSYRRRSDDRIFLVNLRSDPREQHDVAAEHVDVVERHRARLNALTVSLAAPDAPRSELTEEDEARLRELGYLE